MTSQPTTPMKAAASSMRHTGYIDSTRPPERGHVPSTNPQVSPSRSGNTQDRHHRSEHGGETTENTGFDDSRSGDIRVFNDTNPRRPVSRRDSYPPAVTESSVPPVISQSRRGSITTATGNRPRTRGLSFYDARELMRSGRPPRPDSWHGGAPPQSWYYKDHDVPTTPTTPTRRVTSANVEEGIPNDDSPPSRPPSPPPPAEKIPGNVSWALFMNSDLKNHIVASIGEIVGTTMFLFFAFAGTAVANVSSIISDNTTTSRYIMVRAR
jgi:hypothetical protein